MRVANVAGCEEFETVNSQAQFRTIRTSLGVWQAMQLQSAETDKAMLFDQTFFVGID